MGTNFYWRTKPENTDEMDPEFHIGKRSAAGKWCWNCGLTLCKSGVDKIHNHSSAWYDACPKCGAVPLPLSSLTSGAGAVELGFAKPREMRPVGVHSCASFTWAQDPASVRVRCEKNANRKVVVDEYGNELTGQEFLKMVEMNCPVMFYSIGEWFS